MIDVLNGLSYSIFMLHYNFPPYSVGEVGRFGAPSRRDIGHGKLAWRALHAVLPTKDEFPYTIRITSDITESNGSSSKIGRASCRERVCQYVSISVVAVSLKKKNKQQQK